MTFVEFQNGYDMVPHSWIFECLQMFGQQKIHKINVLQTSMSDWKIELFAYNNHLESMSMKKGIFLKDLFYSVVPYAILYGSQDAGKRLSLGKKQT